MKIALLSVLAVLFSCETFAQVRRGPAPRPSGSVVVRHTSTPPVVVNRPNGPVGPRYNPTPRPSGGVVVNRRTTPPVVINRPSPGPVIINRPVPGPIVVGPRYNPNPYSTRVIHVERRPPVVWTSGYGFSCSYTGDLLLDGRLLHSFMYSSDCSQALSDIRVYGDFCDREDLYDQTGILEAQFSFDYECRNALGYYY